MNSDGLKGDGSWGVGGPAHGSLSKGQWEWLSVSKAHSLWFPEAPRASQRGQEAGQALPTRDAGPVGKLPGRKALGAETPAECAPSAPDRGDSVGRTCGCEAPV